MKSSQKFLNPHLAAQNKKDLTLHNIITEFDTIKKPEAFQTHREKTYLERIEEDVKESKNTPRESYKKPPKKPIYSVHLKIKNLPTTKVALASNKK